MKVKEFYDYLTTHMTPEEALLKLLEGHVKTYEKLKFNEGEELNPVIVASMAAYEMNWVIGVSNDDDDNVCGLIMGTQEYVDDMLDDNLFSKQQPYRTN